MSEHSLINVVTMTSASTTRRRAPAMSPQQRRAAIIQAALPLLAEHGMKVTTSQIAAAAGIAEGTVFRVFADKQDLIAACVAEVMSPERGLAEVRSVPRDLDLPQRLARVTQIMTVRMVGIGALMHALAATGYRFDRLRPDKHRLDRDRWLREVVRALVELIGPDAGSLRITPERTAHLLLGVIFSSQFAMRPRQDHASGAAQRETGDIDTMEIDIAELVDIFLHGVLKERPPDAAGHEENLGTSP